MDHIIFEDYWNTLFNGPSNFVAYNLGIEIESFVPSFHNTLYKSHFTDVKIDGLIL